jgi:hypothetical protein
MPDMYGEHAEDFAYRTILVFLVADYIHRQPKPLEAAAAMQVMIDLFIKEIGADLPARFVDEVQVHLKFIIDGACASQAQWPDPGQKLV